MVSFSICLIVRLSVCVSFVLFVRSVRLFCLWGVACWHNIRRALCVVCCGLFAVDCVLLFAGCYSLDSPSMFRACVGSCASFWLHVRLHGSSTVLLCACCLFVSAFSSAGVCINWF